MRKFGFGVVWFFALSMAILILGGAIVGADAGANDPANSYEAGQAAGQVFGQKYGGLIFIASFIIATVGTIFGWLPGTKSKDV